MTTPDPYASFNFIVEIEGLATGGFSDVSGLTSEADVNEYREGSEPSVRKLTGLRKHGSITLTRGITQSRDLYDWYADVMKGNTVRRNGSVVLLDTGKAEIARWHFLNAFPCRWEGPALDGSGSAITIETLTLCCEGIERVTPART